MDTVLNITKRKKRKTRKCLDEIRKRSRQNYEVKERNDELIAHKSNNQKVYDKIAKNVNNNCITSNRLTLAMFPKAVRSETITRPALAEIQNKNAVFGELPIPRTSTRSVAEIEQEKSMLLNFVDSNTCEESEKEHGGSCSSSLSFLSPNRVNQPRLHANMSPDRESMSTASTPLEGDSVLPSGYHLYQQFMADLSTQLIENAPGLIKDNVMKKTKAYLQRIYMNSCQSEYQNNAKKCTRSNDNDKPIIPSPAAIEENPINYIKYGCSYQQDSVSTSPKNSPNHLSSSPSGSTPQADSSIADSDTPLRLSIINDTPEYNYYPRKLN